VPTAGSQIQGKLVGLKWEDVDFEADQVYVRRAIFWMYGQYQPVDEEREEPWTFVAPKTSKSRRAIDLSPELKKELKRLYDEKKKTVVTAADIVETAPTGLVFCREDGRPWDPDKFVKGPFAVAVAGARLGQLRFHDLRHTYGSLKIAQGENPYYRQRQIVRLGGVPILCQWSCFSKPLTEKRNND
jgi:integrase